MIGFDSNIVPLFRLVGENPVWVNTNVCSHNVFLEQEDIETTCVENAEEIDMWYRERPEEKELATNPDIVRLGRNGKPITIDDIDELFEFVEEMYKGNGEGRSYFFEGVKMDKRTGMLELEWGS